MSKEYMEFQDYAQKNNPYKLQAPEEFYIDKIKEVKKILHSPLLFVFIVIFSIYTILNFIKTILSVNIYDLVFSITFVFISIGLFYTYFSALYHKMVKLNGIKLIRLSLVINFCFSIIILIISILNSEKETFISNPPIYTVVFDFDLIPQLVVFWGIIIAFYFFTIKIIKNITFSILYGVVYSTAIQVLAIFILIIAIIFGVVIANLYFFNSYPIQFDGLIEYLNLYNLSKGLFLFYEFNSIILILTGTVLIAYYKKLYKYKNNKKLL